MRTITPCLWFDHDAEQAAERYTSLFPDSRIDRVSRAPADFPSGQEGDVLTVDFTLMGRPFQGLNGGPELQFTEAVSFVVECDDQAEVDRYWEALLEGGQESQCGWLKDRFGLSWQIVPKRLQELLDGPDPAGAKRAWSVASASETSDARRCEARRRDPNRPPREPRHRA